MEKHFLKLTLQNGIMQFCCLASNVLYDFNMSIYTIYNLFITYYYGICETIQIFPYFLCLY